MKLCYMSTYIDKLIMIFTTRIIEEVLFLINFIGMILEAGNETREKIWSDFGAEQK